MVVARALGFETGDLVLSKDGAGAKINPEPKLGSLQEVCGYMKARMMVLYAGVLAESLKAGKVQNQKAIELANGIEGKDDRSKVSEFSKIVAGIECGDRSFGEVASEVEAQAWNRSAYLVEKYGSQIVALSKIWRETVGGAEDFAISASDISNIDVFANIPVGGDLGQA